MLINSMILLVSYLIGSIPTGYWVARMCGINDITQYGSGNIGATNVGRMLGIKYFLMVFLVDVIKSFLCVQLIGIYYTDQFIKYASSATLLIGNSFSLFLAGKGGKGIATAAGIIFALDTTVALCTFVIWLIALLWKKTVGIASVISLIMLPVITLYIAPYDWYLLIITIFIMIWCTLRHSENIRKYYASVA